MNDDTKWEEIRTAEEDGVHYLLVDERIILRTTSKRIVEHYYNYARLSTVFYTQNEQRFCLKSMT